MCSGKRHANFVYFVDDPTHTKTPKEIRNELTKQNKQKVANAKKANKESRKALKMKIKQRNKKYKKGEKII